MEFEHIVKTEHSEKEIRSQIDQILIKLGYHTLDSKTGMLFQRGSFWGSIAGFTPKSWKARVLVEFFPQNEELLQAKIKYNINTSGQWVTNNEREFWKVEFDNLLKNLESNNQTIPLSEGNKINQRALSQNILAAFILLAMAAIMSLIGFLLFRDQKSIMGMGLTGIVIGMFIIKHWFNQAPTD